jgi:hypothetical protein
MIAGVSGLVFLIVRNGFKRSEMVFFGVLTCLKAFETFCVKLQVADNQA